MFPYSWENQSNPYIIATGDAPNAIVSGQWSKDANSLQKLGLEKWQQFLQFCCCWNGTWFYNTKLFPYTQCSRAKNIDFIQATKMVQGARWWSCSNNNNGEGNLVWIRTCTVEVLKVEYQLAISWDKVPGTHMVIKWPGTIKPWLIKNRVVGWFPTKVSSSARNFLTQTPPKAGQATGKWWPRMETDPPGFFGKFRDLKWTENTRFF